MNTYNHDGNRVTQNKYWHAIKSDSPIADYHIEIFPKNYTTRLYDLNGNQLNAMNEIIIHVKNIVKTAGTDSAIIGYNLIFIEGIYHEDDASKNDPCLCIHLIPRRENDPDDIIEKIKKLSLKI